MSLHDKLREGLYDAQGRPRLSYARNYFQQYGLDEDSNFQELGDFYLEWRNFDEYIILQKQTESQRTKGEVEKQTIATKCSKRGNDVYWWRVDKRLRFLKNINHPSLFDPQANVKKSNLVFVTLTQELNPLDLIWTKPPKKGLPTYIEVDLKW